MALPEQLVANRALTGDDERIVERRHQHQTGGLLQLVAMLFRVRVAVAEQDDFRPEIAHRLNLDLRRGLRHDDDGADAELPRGKRHTLGVISGARRNDAAGLLGGSQVRHLVVGAPQLEAEHRLQVFTLQKHFGAKACR